jgi:16S rRNA processing protein RimM
VRGALKVWSYADPPESLLQHRNWRLRRSDGGEDCYQVLQSQWDGSVMRVELEGIADRDAAERLRDREILIARDQMPAVRPGEYYREDLQGFTVRNLEGVLLGTLQHFSAPFLKRVDLERREIEMDWPADF